MDPSEKSYRNCAVCQRQFLATQKTAKYCGGRCKRRAQKTMYIAPSLVSRGLAPGTVGAMSELIVAADLMLKGYDVYKALSPHGRCDLVALNGETSVLRVEVKTGRRSMTTGVVCGGPIKSQMGRFDVLAVVVGTEIFYEPKLC